MYSTKIVIPPPKSSSWLRPCPLGGLTAAVYCTLLLMSSLWLTGLRQESCRREATDSAGVFVSAVESDRRVRHDTEGPAAIHGQGRAEHRQTGAGNRDDDGSEETSRRSIDS